MTKTMGTSKGYETLFPICRIVTFTAPSGNSATLSTAGLSIDAGVDQFKDFIIITHFDWYIKYCIISSCR